MTDKETYRHRRIFVVSPVAKNLEGSRDFGELVYLFRKPPQNIHKTDPAGLVGKMRDAFSDFDPKYDYFLPVGNTVLNCMASAVLADLTEGDVPFLFWDSRTDRYHTLGTELYPEDNLNGEAGQSERQAEPAGV